MILTLGQVGESCGIAVEIVREAYYIQTKRAAEN